MDYRGETKIDTRSEWSYSILMDLCSTLNFLGIPSKEHWTRIYLWKDGTTKFVHHEVGLHANR